MAGAALTATEKKAIAASVGKALVSSAAPKKSPGAKAVNVKAAFCQNWPMVKAGLELLQDLVPGPVKLIIRLVIKAGDGVAAVIC